MSRFEKFLAILAAFITFVLFSTPAQASEWTCDKHTDAVGLKFEKLSTSEWILECDNVRWKCSQVDNIKQKDCVEVAVPEPKADDEPRVENKNRGDQVIANTLVGDIEIEKDQPIRVYAYKPDDCFGKGASRCLKLHLQTMNTYVFMGPTGRVDVELGFGEPLRVPVDLDGNGGISDTERLDPTSITKPGQGMVWVVGEEGKFGESTDFTFKEVTNKGGLYKTGREQTFAVGNRPNQELYSTF